MLVGRFWYSGNNGCKMNICFYFGLFWILSGNKGASNSPLGSSENMSAPVSILHLKALHWKNTTFALYCSVHYSINSWEYKVVSGPNICGVPTYFTLRYILILYLFALVLCFLSSKLCPWHCKHGTAVFYIMTNGNELALSQLLYDRVAILS